MMICRKTMSECPTPGMCAPFQGCEPAPQPVQTGWKCPVCGTGNAPWAGACQNVMCGKNWQVTCGSNLPTDIHERVEMGDALPLTYDSTKPIVDYSSIKFQGTAAQEFEDAQDKALEALFPPDFVPTFDLYFPGSAAEKLMQKAVDASIEQLEKERKIDPAMLHQPMSEFPK